MANYAETDVAGTTRRRAKQIIINNPVKRVFGDDLFMHQQPSVTFVMEDRIMMADRSEILIPAGEFTLLLDSNTLSKKYPSIDVKTGVIDTSKTRYGAVIMEMIIDALEDVFVTEGMERDDPSPPEIGQDETGMGSPSPEGSDVPLTPVEPSEDISSGTGSQGEP